jgi:hypothetical protein
MNPSLKLIIVSPNMPFTLLGSCLFMAWVFCRACSRWQHPQRSSQWIVI